MKETGTAEMLDAEYRSRLEPHRRKITAHCYRMLGSLCDAQDVTQDVLIRAWQRLGEVKAVDSTRAWLYKIATNACLDLLRSRRRRTLPHADGKAAGVGDPFGPAREEYWVEPAPDSLFDLADDAAKGPEAQASLRESVSLAFITALQCLPPKQRAALLMIDVLQWQTAETAELLATSVASLNSLLQRARNGVSERTRKSELQSEVSDRDEENLVNRYIQTWESGDLASFTKLVSEDGVLAMPPVPQWFAGREDIGRFWASIKERWPTQFRLVPARANGNAAIAWYRQNVTGGAYEAHSIMLLDIQREHINQMIAYLMPNLFGPFGLPSTLSTGELKTP